MRLNGKTALITGAANGIGKATALLFSKEGANIVLVDIAAKAGKKVANTIKSAGGNALYLHADVSQAKDCRTMISTTEKKFGKLDILFNNAGIMHKKDGDAISTKENVWEKTISINLKSVFLGCKYGIPALRRAGGGAIINTASFVALIGAATPQIAYTASKGGVLALTRELAVLHAKENIRINAICPGPLHTELLMKFLNTKKKKQRRLVHIPMGRFGCAEEIAKSALFLASDESAYITGTSHLVDGGITAAYVTPE